MAESKQRSVRINKIGIQIGDSEHQLSMEEARALRDALDDLLGADRITITPAPIVPLPYPVAYPVPVWPSPRPWMRYWETTWLTADHTSTADRGTIWLSSTGASGASLTRI